MIRYQYWKMWYEIVSSPSIFMEPKKKRKKFLILSQRVRLLEINIIFEWKPSYSFKLYNFRQKLDNQPATLATTPSASTQTKSVHDTQLFLRNKGKITLV